MKNLVVDDGAAKALCVKNSSLLPSGIVAVKGQFERGDTVSIVDQNQMELARGIARYNSEDLDRIKGCRSDQIVEQLGYVYGSVAVHRNDLILA